MTSSDFLSRIYMVPLLVLGDPFAVTRSDLLTTKGRSVRRCEDIKSPGLDRAIRSSGKIWFIALDRAIR